MRICIITVYNSNNYGAFFQAFALKEYLEMDGHEVFFLKHKARNLTKMTLKKIVKKISHLDNFGYLFQIRKMEVFRKSIFNFKECFLQDLEKMDVILWGSDEIWNVARKNVRKFPFFFGVNVNCQKKIAYAPSVNNATYKDFESHLNYINLIKNIDEISVRDQHSKKVLSHFIKDKEISVVVDPTLLHDVSFYVKYMKKKEFPYKYILVYSYGTHLKNDIIGAIKLYANEKRMKIISILGEFPWCDESPSVTPFEMLNYFQKAELIITDTFHGTIFSIIFNKNFIITSCHNTKVVDLTKEVTLSDRILSEQYEISELAEKPIDYESINLLIEYKRKISKEFINKVIN